MPLFTVTWTETSHFEVEVEAKSLKAAKTQFERDYLDNGHQEDPINTEWSDHVVKAN